MRNTTQIIGQFAVERLDKFLADVERDTAEAIANNDIPTVVTHFREFRDLYDALNDRLAKLKGHVDELSHNLLPTLFGNAHVKTIKIDDIGRVTINYRWYASMVDKRAGIDWLRESGHGGLVIETVNAQTLGAFAGEQADKGQSLPGNLFNVSTRPFVSITKD